MPASTIPQSVHTSTLASSSYRACFSGLEVHLWRFEESITCTAARSAFCCTDPSLSHWSGAAALHSAAKLACTATLHFPLQKQEQLSIGAYQVSSGRSSVQLVWSVLVAAPGLPRTSPREPASHGRDPHLDDTGFSV